LNVKNIILSIALFLLSITVNVFSQNGIPDVPKIETTLYDYANLLTKEEQQRLEQKLIKYSNSTSTQIVLVTINSIGSTDISVFADGLAQKWGIGQKERDNCILVLVAKNELKANISAGYGIEHLLTDAMSTRIIELVIIPNFKSANFYAGLNKCSDEIFQLLNGDVIGVTKKDTHKKYSSKIKGVFIVIVFIIFFVFRGKKEYKRKDIRNASSGILNSFLFRKKQKE